MLQSNLIVLVVNILECLVHIRIGFVAGLPVPSEHHLSRFYRFAKSVMQDLQRGEHNTSLQFAVFAFVGVSNKLRGLDLNTCISFILSILKIFPLQSDSNVRYYPNNPTAR